MGYRFKSSRPDQQKTVAVIVSWWQWPPSRVIGATWRHPAGTRRTHQPASLPEHKNFIWLDLPWRPGDASVDVLGYSVRILPMSSTCHTMACFAILSEMAERMG